MKKLLEELQAFVDRRIEAAKSAVEQTSSTRRMIRDLDIGQRYVCNGVAYLHTGESSDDGVWYWAFILTGEDAWGCMKLYGDAVVELVQEQVA